MNKFKSIKLFVTAFMIISLLVTGCLFPASAVENTANDSGLVISNDKVSLSVNKTDGSIILTDVATNQKYYSTPVDIKEDGKTDALNRAKGLSQLILEVIDEKGNALQVNSNVAVSSATFNKTGDKITVKYPFDDVDINITLEYTLKDNSFVASVPLDKIEEKGTHKLLKVSILPFFGAASRDESGYFVIPDGSGALINFNNGKGGSLYSQKVYGTDSIVNRNSMIVTTQNILLPVIGIHKDAIGGKLGGNILLYAESGSPAAMINAMGSTAMNGYNYAYMSFIYRSSAYVTMLENSSNPVSATITTDNVANIDKFAVSYNVLSLNGNYNEMAVATREKLLASGMTADKISDNVYIEAYMSVMKTKYFLGIPYKANQRLTTFDECFGLIEKLDGNTIMMLNGLDKDGAIGGVIDTKFTVNSKLGGIKKYKQLVENAGKLDSKVFPVSEFVNFNKSKWGYTTFFDNARSVDVKSIEKLFYLYGNYQKNMNYPTLRYLLPTKLIKAGNSYISSLKKNQITSAAPFSIGNSPYSSKDGKGCDLISTTNNFTTILKNMKDEGMSVALNSPAAYAFEYTDYAYGMPLRSSNYILFDMDIPFLQLVLNGVKNYSTPAINLTNNIPEMKLLMLESGSSPAYTIIGEEYKIVKDTPLDVLYGANLESLEKSILDDVKEYREIFAKTEGKIKKHTIISAKLRVVEFENGAKIIINYDDVSAEYAGITVEAMSYELI